MVHAGTSRVQRRKEKRRAVMVLGLLLVVSLVSFSFGVMVGKSGSAQPMAVVAPAAVAPSASAAQVVNEVRNAVKQARQPVGPRPVAQAAAEVSPKAVEPILPPVELPGTPEVSEAKEVAEPPAAAAPQKAELTFYETLSKNEPLPLGAGLNPGLKGKTSAPARTAAAAPVEAAAASAAEVVAEKAPMPTAASEGRFVVQVASFKAQADAQRLEVRLQAAGYPAFTETATLGEKGTWYRVRIGPYADSASAQQVVEGVKAREKLSAFMTQR